MRIVRLLGLDDDPLTDDFKFSSQDEDEKMLFQFSQYGESKDNYSTLITRDFNFAEILSSDAAILDLIKKDKRITPEVLASTLKIKVSDVRASITQLEAEGYLTSKAERVGNDVVITRTLSQPLSEITDKKPRTTDYKVMYSYEGPKDDRNRAFCAKLLELNRFYSRPDIERISRNLGYSVWDRRGGWWSKPDGTRSVSCRHKWKSNLVIQRK
jgi:DNA-binding Lrp family transcriptional regulator